MRTETEALASRPLTVREIFPALVSVLLLASDTVTGTHSKSQSGNQEDVRVVVRQLFRRYGYEYTLAPDIQGLVDRSVLLKPFKAALQLILNQLGGTYRMESGIYILQMNGLESRLVGQYGRRQYVTIEASDELYYDIYARVWASTWQPRYRRLTLGSSWIPISSDSAARFLIPNPRLTFSLNKRPVAEITEYYARAVGNFTLADPMTERSDQYLSQFRNLPVASYQAEDLEIRKALRRLLAPFDIRFRVAAEIQGSVSIRGQNSTVVDVLEGILHQLDVEYVLEGDIFFVFPKPLSN